MLLTKIKKTVTNFLRRRVFPKPEVKRRAEVRKLTIIFREAWWHMEKGERQAAMEVFCKCHITNVTKKLDIKPVRAVLERSKTGGEIIVNTVDGDVWSDFTTPDKYMVEFSIDFVVTKPFGKEGESFKSGVMVYDGLNNEYVAKDVLFRYR